jgi:hypothetical protein
MAEGDLAGSDPICLWCGAGSAFCLTPGQRPTVLLVEMPPGTSCGLPKLGRQGCLRWQSLPDAVRNASQKACTLQRQRRVPRWWSSRRLLLTAPPSESRHLARLEKMPWRATFHGAPAAFQAHGLSPAAYEQGEWRQRGAIILHYRSSERGRSSPPRLSALRSQDTWRTLGTDGTINYCFYVFSLK